MSMKSLGPSFDIHLGGEDLVFPHHEDEIAQSEGAGEQTPANRSSSIGFTALTSSSKAKK